MNRREGNVEKKEEERGQKGKRKGGGHFTLTVISATKMAVKM